jgi:hypothetical protein
VQDQQHGVVAVLAPQLDPLVDPADPNEALLDDPVGGGDLKRLGHPALAHFAPGQPADRRRGDDAGRATQNGADHGCPKVPGVALCRPAGASVCRCKDSVQSPVLSPVWRS